MDEKEFEKYVNHECDWLRYYSTRESRLKLTIDCNIYDTLISIGYTKRVIPLDKRCADAILTSNKIIDSNIQLSELEFANCFRDNSKNIFTTLEVYWIMYPEKRLEIVNSIQRDNV